MLKTYTIFIIFIYVKIILFGLLITNKHLFSYKETKIRTLNADSLIVFMMRKSGNVMYNK
jgi:hypothetical protein